MPTSNKDDSKKEAQTTTIWEIFLLTWIFIRKKTQSTSSVRQTQNCFVVCQKKIFFSSKKKFPILLQSSVGGRNIGMLTVEPDELGSIDAINPEIRGACGFDDEDKNVVADDLSMDLFEHIVKKGIVLFFSFYCRVETAHLKVKLHVRELWFRIQRHKGKKSK